MARKLNEDETLKLVQLYGENYCLWDNKSQNYRNRDMRATALRNISQQMQIEGLTPTEVTKKIKSIRATYYLEIDKINKSTRSGASGNVYIPKVKWFEELDSFIRNVTIKRKTTDNSETSNANNADFADAEGADAENLSRYTENNDNSTNSPTPPAHTPAPNSVTQAPNHSGAPRPKRSKLSQMAAMIKDMKSVSNDINMSSSVEETDCDIFGRHVAAQLKKLSEEQSVIAEEEIQKILSKCRLADIQKRTNTYLYPNVHFSGIHTSQYAFTPSPAATTTSSNSSLGFYPPEPNPATTTSGNSDLEYYNPEPNQTTASSHSSLTYYLPQSAETATSNSSLGFHPLERTSMGPTYVDPNQVIIKRGTNNRTTINDEAGSEVNNTIMSAYKNA